MSKILLKIFNIVFPFTDFLYILQLEEYDSARYIHDLPRFFLRRNIQKRDTLKFTKRAKTTLLLSGLFFVSSLLFIRISPVFLPFLLLLIPFFVLIPNVLLTPMYEFIKKQVQYKAGRRVATCEQLKIVAIAGSYGKTTTKQFLYEFLRFTKRTQVIPGNINTPTGIANWVLTNLKLNTEILIVEMDTYFKGEITSSCRITPPDIAIITSIGDQHIERFGTKQKMARAIVEVFDNTKVDASLFILKSEYRKLMDMGIPMPNNINIVDVMHTLKTNIVSDSAKQDLSLAVSVAQTLNVPKSLLADSLKSLETPDRRQKITTLYGYQAIDDSYNISFTTATAGLSRARQYADEQKKKLLVVTAGIPEVGIDSKSINSQYADALAKTADHVVILNSIYANILKRDRFDIFNSVPEVFENNERFPAEEYILLMQPELTDLYY